LDFLFFVAVLLIRAGRDVAWLMGFAELPLPTRAPVVCQGLGASFGNAEKIWEKIETRLQMRLMNFNANI
jgi:hypothetical protein